MSKPLYSVVIPAHNEARVIARLLKGLLGDFAPGDPNAPEVIVVCNGCSDATAQIAREAAPGCTVIELEQGSKPLALNTGNAAARALPRFFIDADIVVTHADLLATAAALGEPGVCAAAPAIRVDLNGCSRSVRAYYKIWQSQPYVKQAMVGSGVFGLSAEGLAAVLPFPNIIADDGYVRTRFTEAQRRSVGSDAQGCAVGFTVFPPRRLLSLLSIEARRRRGDAQLRSRFPTEQTVRSTRGATLLQERRAGGSLADVAIYSVIKASGRAILAFERLTGRRAQWHRDESSRV